MRGFLSVLDTPVSAPHLRELGRDRDVREPATESGGPLNRLSEILEAVLGRLTCQDQALRVISEIAYRINGGAVDLQRRAKSVCNRHRPRELVGKGEDRMRKSNASVRGHRSAALGASWQDWIVEPQAVNNTPGNGAQSEPSRPSHEAIAQLAYAIWEQRGCPIGSPEQDWLRAEHALLREHYRQ